MNIEMNAETNINTQATNEKQNKDAWNQFTESGKVADYIAYTAGVPQASQAVKQSASHIILENSAIVNLPKTKGVINADKNKGTSFKTT